MCSTVCGYKVCLFWRALNSHWARLFNFETVSAYIRSIQLPGDLETRKRPGTSCKIEIHFWFKITQYLFNGIRFYLKFVPVIHFPVEDRDTKFQTVSQKNQGITSD
jgi:hypothetical protein